MKLEKLEGFEIHSFLDEFNEDRDVFDREASYDFCYNYFRNFYEDNCIEKIYSLDNLEVSCLQLAFYLASWGMYRGSSKLFQKSIKVYEEIIKEISKEHSLWEIDVDNYDKNNIYAILKFKIKIEKSLEVYGINASDTLTTKIIMGFFGCVPAFDYYFKKGLKVKTLNKNSLTEIKEFYDKNCNVIDLFYGDENFKTFDVTTKDTRFNYKKAKIIDMIGYILGEKIEKGIFINPK